MKSNYIILIALFSFFFLPPIKSQTCNSATLTYLSQYQTASPNAPQTPIADRLNRPYLYVAAKDGGLLIFDISDIYNPILIKTLNIYQFDSLHVMNIHQEGNYLYVAIGNFFGNVGSAAVQKPGMAIVDVSTPSLAYVTDTWKYAVKERGASFITVQGNYAYLSAMHKGIMILDITDKNNILFVSEYQPNINFPLSSPSASQMPNARGMELRGDSVFLCYDAGGLRVINIVNKNAPFQVAQYINPGSAAKQAAFNNIVLNGNIAYIAEDYCGMEIVNISNVASINQVGWWNPYHCESFSNWWLNSPGHTNQIHYSATDNAVFMSAGGSQLRVLNVTNPTLPDSCNGYGISGDGNGTWGLDFYNNKIYLANFIAAIPFNSSWAGIKIFDWQSAVSVNELNKTNDFEIYPNPFNDEANIQFSNDNFTKALVEICDVSGRILMKSTISNTKIFHWNGKDKQGNELRKGIYFIKITQENNSITKKVIKL